MPAWLGFALGLAMLALGPQVASANPEARVAARAVDARVWLARMHTAANTGNYRGTMVFSSGGAMSSSRVSHYWVGEQTYEMLESLDGRQRRVYRRNDDVQTLWPQSRVAVLEKRETRAGWSATPQRVDPRVLEHYELRREGVARVAGREAVVFLLEPQDTLRYAQRLWADQATGLMLRADVLGPLPRRAVVESAAFSEVEIDIKPQPETIAVDPRMLEGYRIVRPVYQRTELETEGWTLARAVPGFLPSGCVKRPLEASSEEGRAQVPVVQAVYSDGLAHVSLFIETFDPRRHTNAIQAHLGATSTLMQRRDDFWITVVGDAPVATLRLFADGLERRR